MEITGWSKRLSESTRGRLVELLRRSRQTVDELAAGLGLTDNAVRMHLAGLERDGLVRQEGVRRGGGAGKPATIYAVSPDAEPLFSRAYVPVLSQLLAALADRLTPAELEALMREVGRRLAAGQPAASDRALEPRVRAAAALLEQLGGIAQVEQHPSDSSGFVIRGCGCPLSAAVTQRPETCRAVEELLATVTGAAVREHCDRSGERPQCCFELSN